jgi:hypothetical protein
MTSEDRGLTTIDEVFVVTFLTRIVTMTSLLSLASLARGVLQLVDLPTEFVVRFRLRANSAWAQLVTAEENS